MRVPLVKPGVDTVEHRGESTRNIFRKVFRKERVASRQVCASPSLQPLAQEVCDLAHAALRRPSVIVRDDHHALRPRCDRADA